MPPAAKYRSYGRLVRAGIGLARVSRNGLNNGSVAVSVSVFSVLVCAVRLMRRGVISVTYNAALNEPY